MWGVENGTRRLWGLLFDDSQGSREKKKIRQGKRGPRKNEVPLKLKDGKLSGPKKSS